MGVNIEPLYFSTKTLGYVCKYDDIFERLSKISISAPNPRNNNFILNSFSEAFKPEYENFLKGDVYLYNCEESKKIQKEQIKAKKFVLFELDVSTLKNDFKSFDKKVKLQNDYKKVCESLKDFALYFSNKNKTNICKPLYNTFCDIVRFSNQEFYKEKANESYIKSYYSKLRSNVKKWKNSVYTYREAKFTDLIDKFSVFCKYFQKIDSYFDVNYLLKKSKMRVFVLLAKNGLVSVAVCCFLNEYKRDITQKNHNYIALELSKKINSISNKMPSIFSNLDFNNVFGFEGSVSIYAYSKLKGNNTISEKNNILRYKSKVFNCVCLNVAINEDNKAKYEIDFFDYLSLLVGENYSFNELHLLHYLKTFQSYPKASLDRYDELSNPNAHLFYDGGKFTYSVVNPIYEMATLSTKTKYKQLQNTSHVSRYVYLWKFSSLCFSSCISSQILLAKELCADFYSCNCKRTDYLEQITSNIERQYFSTFSNIKEKNEFGKSITKNYSIDKIKEEISNIGEFSNKKGSSYSGKLMTLIGLAFTICSLLITIISYGMISKIFIDGYAVSNIEYYNKPPASALMLLFDVVKTPKFRLFLVLSVIIIALIWFLVFIHNHRIKKKTNNIVELIGLKVIKLNNKRKKCLSIKLKELRKILLARKK